MNQQRRKRAFQVDEDESLSSKNQAKQDYFAISDSNGGICKKFKLFNLENKEDLTGGGNFGDVAGNPVPIKIEVPNINFTTKEEETHILEKGGMLRRYLDEIWGDTARNNVDNLTLNDKIKETGHNTNISERDDSQYSADSLAESIFIHDLSDDDNTTCYYSQDSGAEFRHVKVDHHALNNI